jgi:hypothetical protein
MNEVGDSTILTGFFFIILFYCSVGYIGKLGLMISNLGHHVLYCKLEPIYILNWSKTVVVIAKST